MLEFNGTPVPDDEVEWSFARSGGPGGQNVNKVESKAHLRWHVAANKTLPEEVKARLLEQQATRITSDGDLLVSSQKHRDQDANRQECVNKVLAMLAQAANPPRRRRPTKPSRAAKEKRLQSKRRRSAVKEGRRAPES
ncbi:MAG: aminoacyl-tRNA hydrolase [Armatimonadetes bacterium]|nr:aminoacyl-tRNA hydrolase [Armatimonadota bacterium]